MKLVRVTFLFFVLSALLMPAFSAWAAEEKCTCTCISGYQLETFVAQGEKPPDGAQTKSGPGPEYTVDGSVTESECDALCQKNKPEGTSWGKEKACLKGDCWCKDGKDAEFVGQTGDLSSCEKVCNEKKLDFGSFGAPPPVKTSAVKCPPGGMWTREECEAVLNADGVQIGEWKPPSPGDTKGPYCFVKQVPVELQVPIGGLTSATLGEYLGAAFKLAIGVAAVLAVIMIMIGGFRYITAAGGGGVQGAKDMIRNAVIGLVLAMLSYTLLQTVNPDILSLNLPRVKIVKACNINVSCAARENKEACENNDPTSGMRCIWSVTQSMCYDNSSMESGAVGMNGGSCAGTPETGFKCTDGSKCIKIDSNNYKCSKGGSCQACANDSDCSTVSGAPGKCTDNVCVVPDPNGQPGSYLKCGNGSCKKNEDCDTGFCNGSGHCAISGQGTDCSNKGDADCAAGYKCVDFTQSGGVVSATNPRWKSVCCLNGDGKGCLGCDPTSTYKGTDDNPACPKLMKCDQETNRCVSR